MKFVNLQSVFNKLRRGFQVQLSYKCFSLCFEVVLTLQFGALGGLGGGGGVKNEAVQHCWGVVRSKKATILPSVA